MTEKKTVTVVIDRRVLPGKEELFEQYQHRLIEAASGFQGHQGAEILRPDGNNRYILVFRFSSQELLDTWSGSEVRNHWVSKIDEIIEEPPRFQTITGLETWFTLKGQKAISPPSRLRMAFVTYLAIAPTIMVFNLLFGRLFEDIPETFRILAQAPFIVILMTWMVMPFMTKIFRSFLFPDHDN